MVLCVSLAARLTLGLAFTFQWNKICCNFLLLR